MKRYDIDWCCPGACLTATREIEDGQYVEFDDAAREIESLTAEVERLRQRIEELEAKPDNPKWNVMAGS